MRKKREHEAKGGVVSRPSFLQSTTKANHDPDLRKNQKLLRQPFLIVLLDKNEFECLHRDLKRFPPLERPAHAQQVLLLLFIYLFVCLFARPVRAKKLRNHRSLSYLACKQAHCLHPARFFFPLNSHKWACPLATSDHRIKINGTNFLPPKDGVWTDDVQQQTSAVSISLNGCQQHHTPAHNGRYPGGETR